MNKQIFYEPNVFNKESIDDAKKIILTNEDSSTNERWAKETDFLYKDIIAELEINQKMLLLDYGCGIGRVAKELIHSIDCTIIGVDISNSMRKMSIEYVGNAKFCSVSREMFLALVEKGIRFDACYSIWVLQHIPNVNYELKLIHSSIKRGGLMYILNNINTAIPTNVGWIDNKIDIKQEISNFFSILKEKKLPIEVSSPKISTYSFIAIYKRNNNDDD